MPRNLRSVVTKPTQQPNSEEESGSTAKKRRKTDRNGQGVKTPMDTKSKQKISRARRNLNQALEMDRALNSPQIGEAERLMYAVLPGNSKFIKNLNKESTSHLGKQQNLDDNLKDLSSKNNEQNKSRLSLDSEINNNSLITQNNSTKHYNQSRSSCSIVEALDLNTASKIANNTNAAGQEIKEINCPRSKKGDVILFTEPATDYQRGSTPFKMAVDPSEDD